MKNAYLLTCSLLMLAATNIASAEPLVALTSNNQLIRFTSTNPAATTAPVTITGLTAGDVLGGIDVRPFNNTLYAFATDAGLGMSAAGVGRVYAINITTGAATLAATLSADPNDTTAPTNFTAVEGTFFGVDFNPVADRLRVTTDTGQNLRINLSNGATQLDVPLAYVAADANFGTPPAVVASAYTNSVAGAMTTLLYNLDSSISTLVTQAPMPNSGTLNTTGLTTGIVFPEASFDISGQTGIGYVVLDGVTLSRINLANGEMTEVGPIGAVNTIAGIAVLVPEPASIVLVGTSLAFATLRRRRR
jgi:hypothetical protein